MLFSTLGTALWGYLFMSLPPCCKYARQRFAITAISDIDSSQNHASSKGIFCGSITMPDGPNISLPCVDLETLAYLTFLSLLSQQLIQGNGEVLCAKYNKMMSSHIHNIYQQIYDILTSSITNKYQLAGPAGPAGRVSFEYTL